MREPTDTLIDELIARNRAKPRPGMERMDEGLRDRTAAKRKAVAEAVERRRRELEVGLIHEPGHVRPFARKREA